MSSRDIDDYNKMVEDHNRGVDECSGGEAGPYKKGCGVLFAQAMNLILGVAVAFAVIAWLQRTVTAPITDTPDSVWIPAVNPEPAPSGGYVPALYVAYLPGGERCYVSMGILVDQLSCLTDVR